MLSKIPHKRSLLCSAVALSLLPLAVPSFAQDATVEEVIVTGSYIRRSEGFQQASSVTQLSAEDLIDEGTLNLGEVVQNLSFVNGAGSAITNTIQGTDSRSTTIDLRGLGGRSTLTLLDGKRLLTENVNALIPTIAIQRLDIVADGAAALYGNEAVAGVVNFVPYKSYDGFKLDTYAEEDSDNDYDEHSVQMLWGGAIGDLDVVLAYQYRVNSRLGWDERPSLSQAGLTMSSNAPGNYRAYPRGADGNYTPDGSYSNTIDPNCGTRGAFEKDTISTPYGAKLGSTCFFEFGDNRSYREPTETNQFYANATWDVSDDLTLTAQGFSTRLFERTYASTSNPGGTTRIGQLPAIRGEIPGNPFVATDSSGNQLYGQDLDGNGIPDRGTVDVNDDGWMDYIVTGTVNNGIPLNEDVKARRLRPINKTMGNDWTPTVQLDSHSPDMDNLATSTDRISRASLTADFNVPFVEGWEGTASYTYNYRDIDFMSNQNYDISEMIKGLNCDVAGDRDSCYSPFFVMDPQDATKAHVLDAIMARDHEGTVSELSIIDIVFTGDLNLGGFELPGGPIGMAFGYQHRDDTYKSTPANVEIAGDAWIGSTVKEDITAGNREVDAYFGELAIPLLSNLELEIAVRREDFSTDQESSDPKYGITWAPFNWLTLRATDGDAFIAPTVSQLTRPETCGLTTVTDRFGPFSAFTTGCSGGNAALGNESSESKQYGFDVQFGEFDFHVTWNETDFQNRIITTSGQTIIELDYFNFQQWSGFTGDGLTAATQPSEAQLESWVASGLQDPRITRSPDDLYDIIQMKSGASNAESVKVTAFDIQGGYRFSLDNIGDFRIGLQATYIEEFEFQEDPLSPVIDGAGKYNDSTGAAPNLPEWKWNLRIGWSSGNHVVSSTVHYVDGMPYDGPSFSHMDGFAFTNRPAGMTKVRDWTDMDFAYTYRGLEVFDGEASFSVGARNVFDRKAQRSPEFAGVIGQLQDPLGRVFYARLVYDF